jgi:serralysin
VAAVASVTPSSNVYVNALLGGYKWASGSLTYSFPASYSYYESSYGSNEPSRNFEALNTTQQGVVRAAFANFAAVANVTFSELTGASAANATLRLAMSDAPSTAWAYMPSTGAAGGDSWYNNASGVYDNPKKGNYAYATFLHEIGHALGLEHPHENAMPTSGDGMEFTVMSYRAYEGAPLTGYTNESWGFAQSLMMYDIAAMQHLYGANFTTNSGNTTYSWSPTTGQAFINGVAQSAPGANRVLQTVWDGGGNDTYDFSNYATNLDVDLRPGQWITTSSAQLARLHYHGSQIAEGNIANALQYSGDVRSLIENAVGGGGNDTIIGNAADNRLRGGGGDDVLDGGDGKDTAVFIGLFAQYQQAFHADGSVTLWDTRPGAPDGKDTLRNIEYLSFSDSTVSLTPFSGAGSWTGAGYGPGGWHIGDFNGDGATDIFRYAPGRSGADMFQSDGGKFNHAGSWTGAEWGDMGWEIGDFNGDGRDDIFRYVEGTSGADVFLSDGSSFYHSGSWTGAGHGLFGWSVGDFDGNGQDDIFRYLPGSSGADVFLSNGSSFYHSGSWTGAGTGSLGWEIGDFNGDGRDDIMRSIEGRSNAEVFLSMGNAFVFDGSWSDGISTLSNRSLGDFNGDGRVDLLQGREDGSGSDILFSDGNRFWAGGFHSHSGSTTWSVGDFDGSGTDDIFRYVPGYSGADVWLA